MKDKRRNIDDITSILIVVIPMLSLVITTLILAIIGLDVEKAFWLTLVVTISCILLVVVTFIYFKKWLTKYYNSIIDERVVYKLDIRTGDWTLENPDIKHRRADWEETKFELEFGEIPVIKEVRFGNEKLYGTRYVRFCPKEVKY